MIRGVTLVVLVGLLAAAATARRVDDPAIHQHEGPGGIGYGTGDACPMELRPLGLAQLAREAEAVVLAEVLDVQPRWNEDRDFIWTETRLRVESTWRGDPGAEVVVSEPGGYIAPVGMRTSLSVGYRPGERAVVFLHHDALDQWRTLGVVQGRFSVQRDASGDRVDLAAAYPHVLRGLVGSDRSRPPDLPLERFRALVLTLAADTPKREGR